MIRMVIEIRIRIRINIWIKFGFGIWNLEFGQFWIRTRIVIEIGISIGIEICNEIRFIIRICIAIGGLGLISLLIED